MTYLQFHFVFILPVITLLALLLKKPVPFTDGKHLLYISLTAIVAFIYTVPWDNYLVWKGIWEYGNENVIGVIGYVPIEEYMFFLFQPFLTGLFFFIIIQQSYFKNLTRKALPFHLPHFFSFQQIHLPSTLCWVAVAIFGFYCLFFDNTLYMGLILAWAFPVVAGLWVFVGKSLLKHWKIFMTALWIPTLYLWVADAIAINLGIWSISLTYTTHLFLFGLPMEEALFFFTTNLLVILSLAMFLRIWEIEMDFE